MTIFFLVFFFFKEKSIVSPVSEETPTSTLIVKLPSKTLKEYHDASGFKFSYPEDLILKEKEINKESYVDLELTSPETSGSMSLKITDSKLKSLDDWLLENKEATMGAEIKNIQLADIGAKEIKSTDKILTIALDQTLDQVALFTIEINPQTEEQYWISVYNTLISTFVFADNEKTQESQVPATGGEIIFEGEEIIE